MMWESEAERRALLAEVLREQAMPTPAPSTDYHRNFAPHLTAHKARKPQVKRDTRPGGPAKPEDKRPQAERPVPQPSALDLALARHFAGTKVVVTPSRAPASPAKPAAKRRPPRSEYDALDLKALEWLNRAGFHR